MSALDRIATALYRVSMAVAAAALLMRLAAKFSVEGVWDDAHMFGRYADHALDEHVLAWNPGGPPTYGMTTPLFVLVVAPIRLLLRHAQPGLAVVLPSMVSTIALLVALYALVRRTSVDPPWVRRALVLGLTVVLARPECALPVHFATGMDTTFDALYLAAHLLVVTGAWSERHPIAVGVMGGAAFWVRPDLVLFTLAVPVGRFVLEPTRRRERLPELLSSAVTLGAILAVNAAYFRSALPLPFYAKSTGLYGAGFAAHYRGAGLGELGNFVSAFWPLMLVPAVDIARGPRAWWAETSATEKSILAAAIAFSAYYAAFVLAIMGHYQRFYFPTLPAWVFLTACSMSRIGRTIGVRPSAGATALAFCWMFVPGAVGSGVQDLVVAARDGSLADFDLVRNYELHHATYWFRLDEAAALPDDVVVAATEVGYPAALMPRKRIIDMAGLNDPELSRTKFSAELFLARFEPDLIYMPHPDYVDMLRSLEASERLRADYEMFPPDRIHTPLGVAIRRGSASYSRMHRIFAAP